MQNQSRIVDAPKPERPLKVEDIREALAWAKKRGKLDQPLYIFFIDHGGDDKFQLSKLNDMSAAEFKAILDDYQQATDNEIVLVIDACHSGNLLKQIIAPKRSIISSTGTGLAYFDRENKKGFGYFFASGLLRGMSFFAAFEYSKIQQEKLLGNITKVLVGSSTKTETNFKQEPQFEDGNKGDKLRKLFINGNFTTGDITLAVAAINKAKKWQGKRTQTNKLTLFDLTLPENLAKGEYCLYGILSPRQEKVLETIPLWIMKKQCFDIK